jgi:hypothetical protein
MEQTIPKQKLAEVIAKIKEDGGSLLFSKMVNNNQDVFIRYATIDKPLEQSLPVDIPPTIESTEPMFVDTMPVTPSAQPKTPPIQKIVNTPSGPILTSNPAPKK